MKYFSNKWFLLCVTVIVSGVFSTVSAATLYTSKSVFLAAVDTYYLEEFDFLEGVEDLGLALQIENANGLSYTIEESGGELFYANGSITTNTETSALIFNFAGENVTAFGGFFWPTNIYFENKTADIGIEILFTGGVTDTFTIENAAYGTFTGFISDEAMKTVRISGGPNCDELYATADDICVGTAGAASAVPVPAAIWLLGTGLMGFVGLRRKAHK